MHMFPFLNMKNGKFLPVLYETSLLLERSGIEHLKIENQLLKLKIS